MLATIALALCILAGDKIYDAFVPEARAGSYTWICGYIPHGGTEAQEILNERNALQVALVKDPSPGRSGVYGCFAF